MYRNTLGATRFNGGGHPGPNLSLKRTKTRALRGFCPLSS